MITYDDLLFYQDEALTSDEQHGRLTNYELWSMMHEPDEEDTDSD